jgi:photosystem II stability/assembly factor-like uncharacterized protein
MRYRSVILLSLLLFSCMKDVVSDWRDPNFIGLKELNGVQFSNESTSVSHPVAFLPKFKGTDLDYTVYADSGEIHFYTKVYPTHAKIDFIFKSMAVSKSKDDAGADYYRIMFNEPGLAVIQVTDTMTWDTTTYSLHLKMNPSRPQNANGIPKLKRLSLCSIQPSYWQVHYMPGHEGPRSGTIYSTGCQEAYPPVQVDSILFKYESNRGTGDFSYVLFASSILEFLLIADVESPSCLIQVHYGNRLLTSQFFSEVNRSFYIVHLDTTLTAEIKLVLTDTISHLSQTYHLAIKKWTLEENEKYTLNPGGWTEIRVPKDASYFEFINDSVAIQTLQTEQAFMIWRLPEDISWILPKDDPSSIQFLDEKNAIEIMENGDLLRTNNGGLSWDLLQSSFWTPNNALMSISSRSILPGNFYYFVGDSIKPENQEPTHYLIKSMDGGLTWKVLEYKSADGQELRGPIFLDSLNGISTSTSWDNKLFSTNDGGVRWDLLEVGNKNFPQHSIQSFSDNTLMLIKSDNSSYPMELYASFDFGKTWNEVLVSKSVLNDWIGYPNFPVIFQSTLVGFCFYENDNGGYILKTSDGGKNWSLDFFDPHLRWFKFYQTTNRVYAETTSRRLFWRKKQ